MNLTLEHLITREEIRDTLTAYSQGLDQRNWDLFDQIWTQDATFEAKDDHIGPASIAEFKALLQGNDATRLAGQHLLNNTWFPLQTTDKPDIVYEVRAGGIYVDDLVRTEDGWKIQRRELVTKNKVTRGVLYTQERIDNIRWGLNSNFFA